MEIIRLNDDNVEEVAKKASKILKEGGIIIYPTDTLYGLGVNALDEKALARLRELKIREQKKPMSILVSSIEHLERYGVMNDGARALAEKHFPGALTLVLPATKHAPTEVQLNNAIGIRIPHDPFCFALTQISDHPVTATSANKSGMPTANTVADLIRHFGPDIAHVSLIIDGGERGRGVGSTVVSCVGELPVVLREGRISKEELGF